MNRFIALLSSLLLLVACSPDEVSDAEQQDAERTVLVYMAAENNLSGYADSDLDEMKRGSMNLDNRQNLIVYIDKAEANPPYLVRIKEGQLVDSVAFEESLTADPAVMERVIRYTREKYHAKSYGLVLWGHANGWIVKTDTVAYDGRRAYGGDTGDNIRSKVGTYWMNIPSMARAIASGMGNDRLHFILADCCCMGDIETAYELRQVTDYLIASPAEIPDRGAPYHLILPDLFSNSPTFYQSVVDTYFDHYMDMFKVNPYSYFNQYNGDLAGYSFPIVVIRSAALEPLARATAQLLSTIPEKLSVGGNFSFDGALSYAYDNSVGHLYGYDICDVLRRNTVETDFQAWKTVYSQAVAYSRFSARWLTMYAFLAKEMYKLNPTADDCGVVSMFIPNERYKATNPNLNTVIQQFQWNTVIRWQQYGW